MNVRMIFKLFFFFFFVHPRQQLLEALNEGGLQFVRLVSSVFLSDSNWIITMTITTKSNWS